MSAAVFRSSAPVSTSAGSQKASTSSMNVFSQNKRNEASLDTVDLTRVESGDALSNVDEFETSSPHSISLDMYEQSFNNSKRSHGSPSSLGASASTSRGTFDSESDESTPNSKTDSIADFDDLHAAISPIREPSTPWLSSEEDTSVSKTSTSVVETESPKEITFEEKLESLLFQMEEEYNAHGIDRAYRTLESVKQLSKSQDVNLVTLKNRMNEKKVLISDIERFYQETAKILKELEDEDGYLTESSKKNASIKYKNLAEGKISIKMESTLDVPLSTLLGLFYEPDGYKAWSPFVSESSELKKLFRAGTATKLKWNLPPPVFGREGYLIGVGFDRLQENGSLLLISKTIHDDKQIQERYNIEIPTGSKTVKMDIHYVGVELVPVTQEKTQMRIVAMFDAKIKLLPARFVSWIVRKGAHYLLEKIVKSAMNPKRNSENNKYAVQNKEFYSWLDNLLSNHFNGN
jgi:hypothetical protein